MKNLLPIDWSKIYKEYKGRWVALDNDDVTVISSGISPKEALEEAKIKGKRNPILMFMPEDLKAFAG
ncbi:hypothetical protein HY224_00160 [Candidatus Uhrbacteria bacterium]|nr:hypothetical protein [Candidatus Uhrbacteria bacterium]